MCAFDISTVKVEVNQQFNDEGLKAHNYLRSLHGCPPLTFALDLAVSAQVYAEKLAGLGTIRHSGYSDVGENLALSLGPSQSTDFSGVMVTLLWYNEISDYEFTGVDQISCGHFSQVVWKETKSIGMGLARTEDGQVIVAVAHYRPPGNVSGQWAANVPYPVQGTAHSPTAEELSIAVAVKKLSKAMADDLRVKIPATAKNSDASDFTVKRPSLQFNGTAKVDAEVSDKSQCMNLPALLQPGRTCQNIKEGIILPQPKPSFSSTQHIQQNLELDTSNTKFVSIDDAFLFAMDVFMEINYRRRRCGLPVFLLNQQLDEVAKELARELKCGLIKKIQPGYVFGKPVRHYSECSRLLDKNATNFVWRCCLKGQRSEALSPEYQRVGIGCEFDRLFRPSSVVILFA
uniref:SCP domain-containing protein n=1 Tax=Mesocestoides corti TaxID=53468 RepID=A0A5K3EMP2_MESCO